MVDLCVVLKLELCPFLDAVAVATIRTVCQAAHSIVEQAPHASFNFAVPLRRHLDLFERESDLLWVLDRLRKGVYLVDRERLPRDAPRSRCSKGKTFTWWYTRTQEGSLLPLDVHVRGFWFHPAVGTLHSTALRLDSPSLLWRIAVEAPGGKNPLMWLRGLKQSNGPDEFMFNCWITFEKAQFERHGHWRPYLRDEMLEYNSDFFYSKVHFFLWNHMAKLRRNQHRDFRGYCKKCVCVRLFSGVGTANTPETERTRCKHWLPESFSERSVGGFAGMAVGGFM